MTKYTLFTDPHLGTRRAAHTTRESAKKLTQALFDQALQVAKKGSNAICLGDLFDRAFNDEATLVQGHQVASSCSITLAGNHDETNREGTVTSLRALQEMGVNLCASKNLTVPYHQYLGDGIFMVPHHASQELFETALFHAAEHAAHDRAGKASVLMLHCNYDAPDFMDVQDDSLNLPASVAEQLLNAFDYILIGHEHRPASHFDSRVLILGNTHPTSFSDISDKYSYTLDIEDGFVQIDKHLIWSQDDRYREIRYGDLLPDLSGVQFVNVVGLAPAEEAVDVADYINDVWSFGDDLLAVRNNVTINQAFNDVEASGEPKLGDLKTHIAAELEGSDLADLFQQLAAEVRA